METLPPGALLRDLRSPDVLDIRVVSADEKYVVVSTGVDIRRYSRREALLRRWLLPARYKQPPLFGEYVKTFLKPIEKPLAQNTVDLHNNSLKSLLKLFKNRFLDQITRSMIEDFKAGRAKELKKGSKTQLVSPATVNRELGTLKKILNMAVDDELISINPARKVRPFPEEFRRPHPFVQRGTRLSGMFIRAPQERRHNHARPRNATG